MKFVRAIAAATLALSPLPALAQESAPPPPKLIVVISVDQFSADLFGEYRSQFRDGLARLMSGAVFPAGYQSHGATETCPGHSTILTGSRPARTGIIGNDWIDLKNPREDKTIYCSEDPSVPGSTSEDYIVSDQHLKVPTLGEWMKLANPASRVVSVAGKDRAAVMMGGHKVDEIWWGDSNSYKRTGNLFMSYKDRTAPALVTAANQAAKDRIAEARLAMDLPSFCRSRDRAIPVGGTKTVGDGRFARAAKDASAFRASPEYDEAVVGLATALAVDMKLGQGEAPDLLIVGATATDLVGHGKGTEGAEMCIQMHALDRTLGTLLATLDGTGVDYAVVLTADHGGHDLPERHREHAAPMAERVDTVPGEKGPVAALSAKTVGEAIAAKLKLKGQLLWGGAAGDVYVDPKLSRKQHDKVVAEAVKMFAAGRQVHGVYTRAQIEATPSPKGPPETWTMLQRARASYDPERSGDFIVVLNPRVTPIADPVRSSVATHGSFWDYDRRVPILFWRKGMAGFEQPLSIETVDIAPTLAALLGIKVPVEIDGRCLDLDAGAGDSCAR